MVCNAFRAVLADFQLRFVEGLSSRSLAQLCMFGVAQIFFIFNLRNRIDCTKSDTMHFILENKDHLQAHIQRHEGLQICVDAFCDEHRLRREMEPK